MDAPFAISTPAPSTDEARLERAWARWSLAWAVVALVAAATALSQLAIPWSPPWPMLGVGRLLTLARWAGRFGAFGLPLLAFLARGPAGSARMVRRGLWLWNSGVILGGLGILGGLMSSEPWVGGPLAAVAFLAAGALLWTQAFLVRQSPGSSPGPEEQAGLVSLVGLTLCLLLGSVLVGTQGGLGQALGGSLFGRGLGELWLFPAAVAAAAGAIPKQAGLPLYGRRVWQWGLWSWVGLAALRLPLDLAPDLLSPILGRVVQAMAVLALVPLGLLGAAVAGAFVGSRAARGAPRPGWLAPRPDGLVRIGFLLLLAGRAVEAATVPPAWTLTQFTAMAPYGGELPGWTGYWILALGLAWPAGVGPAMAGGWRAWAILAGAAAQAAPLWPIALAEVANGSTAELVGLSARVRLPGLVLLAVGAAAVLARAAARRQVPPMGEAPRSARSPVVDDLGWTPVLAWSAAIMTAGMLLIVLIPLADPANYAAGGRRAARDLEAGSLREEGRSLYIREGCVLCHSQRLRAGLDGAHLGPSTRAADYADGPALTGLRRSGPDLAWAGDRFDDPEVLAGRLAVHATGGRPGFPWLFETAGPSPAGDSIVDYLIGLRAVEGGAGESTP